MSRKFAARLAVYAPDGALLGHLHDVTRWSASLPVNDVSALTLEQPLNGGGAEHLAAACEVAVEVSSGRGWVEPRNGRYRLLEVSVNAADGAAGSRSCTLQGYGGIMDGIAVLPGRFLRPEDVDADGKRKFLSASVGAILTTVLAEARSVVGGLTPGLQLAFSAGKDSAGAAWSRRVTIYYAPGTSLLTILDNLAQQGQCDWWMEGRALHVVNPESAAVDTGLRLEGTPSEAPVRASRAGLLHAAFLVGDSQTWRVDNQGAPTPWGRTMTVLNQGGVRDEATARALIGAELARGSQERREYTWSAPVAASALLPLVDYRPGDFLLARGAAAAWERMRVQQVTLSKDQGKLEAALVLNDRFVDAEVRRAKRTKGIVNGASGDAGTGVLPQAPSPQVPATPKGLVADSTGYWAPTGEPRASVTVSWAPVTTDTRGVPMNVQAYDGHVGDRRFDVVQPRATADGLTPGVPVTIAVRALGSDGNHSAHAYATITPKVPDLHLDPPTPPTVACSNGMVTITWDRRLRGGADPYDAPAHLRLVSVEEGPSASGPWTPVADLSPLGPLTVLDRQDQTGQTRWYRAVAVDNLDRRSEPSPVVSVAVRSQIKEEVAAAVDQADRAVRDSDAAKALVEAQASRVGTLEGSVTGLQQKLTDATTAADEAKKTAQAAQTSATRAGAAADAAQKAAAEKAAAAEQASKAYADALKNQALTEAQKQALKAAADAAARAQQAAEAKAADAKRAADAAQVVADAAKAQAAQAKTSSDAATRLANDADTKAGQAQAAATAATSKAASAQAKANEAAAKALTAQAEADAAKASAAQAVRDAAADAQRKADAAREAAKTYAKTQADAAKAAARAEASTDAQAKADAAKAAAVAAAALDAKKKADAAQRAAEAKAEEAKRAAQTAQTRADQAAREAVEAKRVADAASAKALGAQSTADAAAAKATTADGRYTVAVADPAARDGAGKPAGAVWEVRSGAISLRRFVWDGKTWVKVKAGIDFIGDKAIGRAQIADLAVGTQQIADASITNGKLGTVSIDKLDVLGGARFKDTVMRSIVTHDLFAKAVRTNQLVVAADNLIPDPAFKAGDEVWSQPGVNTHLSGGHPVFNSKNKSGDLLGPGIDPRWWPQVHPESRYAIEATLGAYRGAGERWSAQVSWVDTNGASELVMVPLSVQGQGREVRLVGEVTAPKDAVRMKIRLVMHPSAGKEARALLRFFSVRTMAGAVVIEPGAVTTPKLAAGAVTSEVLAAGAVVAGKIAATAIDGMVITGATVRTAASGSRVEMSRSGLRAVNRRGQVTVSIDGENGHFTGVTITGGKVQTAVSGTRTVLEGVGLTMYGGDGQRTTTLDPSGTTFWLGNDPLGQFGRTTWADKPTTHGIAMRLNYRGRFITWGYEESPNSPHYTAMLTLDPKGEVYGAPGINISAPITCGAQQWEGKYWQRLHFGKTTIGGWEYPALMQTDNKVGIAFGTSDMYLIVGNTAFSVREFLRKLNYAI